ncbi:MAG: DUF3365 domain-containing protein [Rhodocyclaceae bacterium]|nr:DUF3365 domain-containing protein [Rhodocyclaceae bacterium]
MNRILLAALIAWGGCVQAGEVDGLLERTRQEVLPVLPKVAGMMKHTVETEGVAAAIPVCKEKAPELMAEKAASLGWKIRRVSLKPRNAQRATPDAWEQAQLEAFDRRRAAGEDPKGIEVGEIVAAADGTRVFRYMKALPVAPVCVQCHGERDALAPELRAAIEQAYPQDRATGYAPGDLRGALSVTRPL